MRKNIPNSLKEINIDFLKIYLKTEVTKVKVKNIYGCKENRSSLQYQKAIIGHKRWKTFFTVAVQCPYIYQNVFCLFSQ